MPKVLAVAWREFKHTALTKAFIIGTIIFPLLIWGGMAAAPLLVRSSTVTLDGTVALIDPAGKVTAAARLEFDPNRASTRPGERVAELADRAVAGDVEVEVDVARATEESMSNGPFEKIIEMRVELAEFDDASQLESLQEQVRNGELLAVAMIDPRAIDVEESRGASVTIYTAADANPNHISAIRRALTRSVVRARATDAGMEVEHLRALLRQPRVATRRLTADGEAAAGVELQQFLPIVFMVLLWIGAFASGNYLLTTTIEEKSNKVMEVLLSAISPWQLMSGKIIGQGVVGLSTIAVYSGLGLGALLAFGMADLIQPIQIVYLGVYFLMAYFMIAAMMAAIGSAVSDLQEAHALITPAMLILFVPMILFMPVSQNPNGPLAVVTSFIPIFTPFVMILRVTSSEPVPAWEIILSMVVGLIGVVGMMWIAARIFRVGVLMYGKPPSPLELIRWLRYS